MQKIAAFRSCYARDNEEAIKRQMDSLEEYCKDNNVKYFKYYTDNNQSGASLNRLAFNKLRQDLTGGKIDRLIVTSNLRLTRNVYSVAQIANSILKPIKLT